jgi:branched-chain amino acid transport system substrate-binding protein
VDPNKTVRRLLRLGAVGVAVTVAAAGCAGSSAKTTPLGPGRTAAATLAGTPVKIGVIVSTTGPQASSNSQGATVAPAWARYVNEQLGGIDGRPVQVVVKDDAGDPATAQSAAKSLVGDSQVVALVIGADSVLQAYVDGVVSQHVAVVSGTANTAPWYTKAGLFPTTTDTVSGITAQVDVGKQYGKGKVFAQIYCAEIAQCAQANPIMQAEAAKDGMKFVTLPISASTPSFTAECLKLQQERVDYAQLNISSAVGAKLISDCQQQGFNPVWGVSEQAIGKDLLQVPNLTAYGPAFAFPSVADAPAAATFRRVMTTYAKGDDWHEGAASYTWQGLETIRKALSAPEISPSRAGVLQGLYGLKSETLGGMLANGLTFNPAKANAFGSQPCYFLVGIKDGKTVAPHGLTPVCVSSSGT